MWSSNSRAINYALPSDMGMVGLRDVFVVAPASSFHHHHHQQNEQMISSHDSNNPTSNAATALGVGVGVGVIPLLTAAPCLAGSQPSIGGGDVGESSFMLGNRNSRGNSGGSGSGMQLWQNQLSQQHGQYGKKQGVLDHGNSVSLAQQAGIGGGGGGVCATFSGGGGGGTTCQDCGNQAKKDCSYRRCRTCCKSRGFDCATHVKSTWVPAARRRERQLMAAAAGPTAAAGSSGSTSGAKKPRLVASQTTTTSHTSTSNTTPPRSYDTSSSRQDASFKETLPGQVCAPAVFKCVKVTSVEDGEDEYAYQAVVKINGHVFRGLLQDTGAEGGEGIPNISELHLGGSSSGGGNGGHRNGGSSSSPIIDPSDVYGASGGGFLGGSNYGNPMN